MIYTADFVEIAGNINYLNIVKYLTDLNWQKVESNRPYVKIFQYENADTLYQANIPTNRELIDYKHAMYRAVEQIALSSKKNIETVLLELLNPVSDILHIRIKEASTNSGSIMVEDAIKLFGNAKKLLTYASMDYQKPSLYHIGKPDLETQNLIENCRFGQTEIGSYVISLVVPFTEVDETGKSVQMTLFNEEVDKSNAHARKVTNKLITSIQQVKAAVDEGILNEIMSPLNKQLPPVSANFLEALSSIGIYKEHSEVDISIKWAPTVNGNKAKVDNVSLTHDHCSPIDTVVQSIKGKRTADERSFTGKISNLKAKPNLEKRDVGEITLVYIDQEKASKAKVVLNKEDYDDAIKAHESGKDVRVIGKILGQKRKIIEYSTFRVLD